MSLQQPTQLRFNDMNINVNVKTKTDIKPVLKPIVGRKGSFHYIDKRMLFCDETYQRDITKTKVEDIRDNFSWQSCGCLVVTERRDGRFAVNDGGHRWAAAMQRDDIKDIPCLVFPVSTIKQEAQVFLDVNEGRRPLITAQKHKARLSAREPDALAIQSILETCGRSHRRDGGVACLSVMYYEFKHGRGDILRRIWPILDKLHGTRPVAEHICKAFLYIEKKLPANLSLTHPKWEKIILKTGYDAIMRACKMATLKHGKGAAKIYAEGTMKLLNHQQKARLHYEGENPSSKDDDE